MDDDERRRRLEAYGFSEETPREAPQQPTSDRQAPMDEPEVTADDDAPTGLTGVLRTGSTLDRIVHSWGFLFGTVVLLGAFLAGQASERGVLPPGDIEALAFLVAMFFLPPSSLMLWWAVGVLAPPAPFRTGLLLGLLQASLFTIFAFLVEPGSDLGTGLSDPTNVLGLWLLALVVASLGTGIVGWLVRRIFMERATSGEAEPPARPLPALVIAITLVCVPLMSLAGDTTEWLVVGLYGATITAAMIAWGLAVQRRHPERRGLIVVVGLVAGLVAGLAMLQAIWTEGRWSHRPKLTDAIAITGAAAIVLLASYGAYGPGGEFASRTYVVAPARDADPSSADVDLTRDILEARMEAIGADPAMRVHDDGRITVRVAEAFDRDVVERSLGSTGTLEFTPVPERYAWDLLQDQPLPEGMVEVEPIFGGSEVTTARLGQDQTTGELVVNLEFSDAGGRLFDEYAEEHFGERFAIVFDDIIVSAPSINATRFGGQAQISGNFTLHEAQAIVAVLSAGRSLPYEVVVEAGSG
jgi:hypothetical protein